MSDLVRNPEDRFCCDLPHFVMFCRMLIKDDRLRWSSTQLLDHTFLKEPVPALLQPLDTGQQEENKTGLSDILFKYIVNKFYETCFLLMDFKTLILHK